ncbi:MAG: DUF3899 domain-containing protein [Lachnospiraceae bacterium]|nr:DUF3899 domain-containing protein [Lachnospiraceae bacterium]
MKERMTAYLRCLATAVIVILAVTLLQRGRGFGLGHSASDGCFVAAVLLAGTGCLRIAACGGFFDLPAYGIRRLVEAHRRSDEEREDFLSYRVRRQKNPKPAAPLLISGIVCLLFSWMLL